MRRTSTRFRYLVVATKGELDLPASVAAIQEDDRTVIVTGIGGTNVIRALKDLPLTADILNVGYCGSNSFPIGTAVRIGKTQLWHPNLNFAEPTFVLNDLWEGVCLTAGDFVLNGDKLPEKSVVDMELAYIAALGFPYLLSIKYVSDNLNKQQYEKAAGHETVEG